MKMFEEKPIENGCSLTKLILHLLPLIPDNIELHLPYFVKGSYLICEFV